jgi:hypothetical protein
MLPPTTLPTQPGAPPSVLPPGGSGYLPPTNPPLKTGPDVLFGDPLPGSSSSRPVQPTGPSFLGGPVKAPTGEPPRTATGLPGFTKVKDGVYAGRKPAIEGYDTLKSAGFRTVIYLHGPGADVSAIKGIVTDRTLQFVAIETTPETLAEAGGRFNEVLGDRMKRPAYVFADDGVRAGAVWYLHFRRVDAADIDAAGLRAKSLGLTDQTEEGRAFWVAILKIMEK